jgi:hypothetical protein
MNLEECLLVKKEIIRIIENNLKKEFKQLMICSNKIYNKIYEDEIDQSLGPQKQFLLYGDDLVFLENIENFRKNYFIIRFSGHLLNCLENISGEPCGQQFGEYFVIEMNIAEKLLKKIKLKSFKNA